MPIKNAPIKKLTSGIDFKHLLLDETTELFSSTGTLVEGIKTAKIIPELKPGYKTSELLLTLALNLGNIFGVLSHVLPTKYAAMSATASISAYALSRGFVKLGHLFRF